MDGITLATQAGMRWSALIVIAVVCSGCEGQNARFEDASQSLQSLRATTTTVVHAWLNGDVSDQFARAAIERTYELAEKTRTSLTASPASLSDSRAAALATDCEQLSRALARLGDSIDRGDRAAAQTALNGVASPNPI